MSDERKYMGPALVVPVLLPLLLLLLLRLLELLLLAPCECLRVGEKTFVLGMMTAADDNDDEPARKAPPPGTRDQGPETRDIPFRPFTLLHQVRSVKSTATLGV